MKLQRLLVILIAMVVLTAKGQDEIISPTTVGTGTLIGISKPLRDIPEISAEEMAAMKVKADQRLLNPKLRYRDFPFEATALPKGPDPVWQKEHGSNRAAANEPNVVFQGQNSPYFPPDCNGTAGPNHYMQTVNLTYAIYDKTGTKLAGPTNMNQLFGNVPGANCNDGDPIILYDEQADRWMAAEFSLCGTPDRMLVAISTTNDPTGTWYQYSFPMAGMPDYEKFGVWHDGYYMATNTSNNTDIYVFERQVMITGGTNPKMVSFDNPWRPSSIDGFMMVPPLDNDGPAAPLTQPGIFIAFNDDAIGGGEDQLWIYELVADWTTPANSEWTRVQQIPVEPFDSNFGNNWNNIKQPGTSQELDGIPQVIMNAPQYRNFGSYQTIVCCHTVDVDATDHAGVRWYELRKTTGDWTVRQTGTYAPDEHSRWMASVVLNGNNEIGLGYSISSTTEYPGIRYTGQTAEQYNLASGIMDVPEGIIHVGTASQSGANRWGDYSLLSVDPSDDRTFWYTNQYVSAGQKTKIGSFNVGPLGPTANYEVDNNKPCLDQTVVFNDLTIGSPISWLWSFSPSTVTYVNGTSATSQHPQVQFNAFGSYDVTLIATSATGVNENTKTDFISVNEANADFEASNTSVVVNNPTIFSDLSSCDIRTYLWNFGADATPATATTAGPHQVTYSTVGEKTVTLTINGAVTETKTNYITVISDVFVMTNQNIQTCTGTFTDPGGNYNYGNNLIYTTTFTPSTPGSQISLDFSEFNLEMSTNCNNDYLQIYNGRNSFSPLIGKYCGSDSPGIVTSDNIYGALTFVFKSNASVVGSGWVANVSCVSAVQNPISLIATTYTDTQINLNWELNTLAEDIILVWSPDGTFGTPVSGTAYSVGEVIAGGGNVIYAGNSAAYNHTSLTPATTYHYKAYSVNGENQYSSGVTAMATTLAEPPHISINPLAHNITAPEGSTVFNVTSNTVWNVVSNAEWTLVTPSGNGTGIINVAYDENVDALIRVATITVTATGLEPVEIILTQEGAVPVLALNPLSLSVDTLAGTANITVSSNAPWEAESNATWLTATPEGMGNGSIIIQYEQNLLAMERMADITVTVPGLPAITVPVTQAAAQAVLAIDPLLAEVDAQAGAKEFNLTANFNWNASTDAPWITIPANGTGSGILNVAYTENQTLSTRSATITVTGNELTEIASIIQAAGSPMVYVSPENANVQYHAGTTNFTVTSNTDWTVSTDSTWLTVTPSGSGNGTIAVTYVQNPYYVDRTAIISITIAGQAPLQVQLTQHASELSLTENEINGLRIYPNPATNVFTIEANPSLYPKMEVQLTDPSGVTVLTQSCSGKEKYTFNTSHLSSGTYLIHIESKDQVITRKIVIMK